LAARGTYTESHGVLQAKPAPRFARNGRPEVAPVPVPGQHTIDLLAEAGLGTARQ
jgi:alpha-methylacyl-CoA racemase